MAIKKINTDLQIEAGLLDGDGNSGTSNQILISTGTGIDWVDGSGSGIIGGPYLPLAGGTVTGQLTLTQNQISSNIGTTSVIRLQPASTTDTTGKSSIFLGTSTVDNYGISLRGARLGTSGTPSFEIATHNNSAEGDVRIKIDSAGQTRIGVGGKKTSIGADRSPTTVLSVHDIQDTSSYSGIRVSRYTDPYDNNAFFGMINAVGGSFNLVAKSGGTIKFMEGQSSATNMVIDGSGNVGIGTANPTNAKVHIVGDGSYVGNVGYNTLTLEDSSGYPGLNLRSGNNNWLIRKTGNNHNLEFYYSADASAQGTGTYSNKFTIDTGGNVVASGTINGSNLSGTNTGDQDLSGYARLTGNNSFTGNNWFNTATNTIPVHISRSGGTNSQVLKIGVTDTVAVFSYIEDTSAEGNGNFGTYQFNLEGTDGETAVNGLSITKTGISAPNLSGTNTGDQDLSVFYTKTQSDSRYVEIAGDTMTGTLTVTDGNTGILVDSATHASLRVDRGSTSYDSNLLFYTAGALDFRIWQDGSRDYLYVRDETGGGGNMVTFKKGGTVGINQTSPSERLHVNGKTYIESQGVNWNETTPGLTRGALHFDPAGNGADNTGNAITFGASDVSNGTNAHAGIYTRSDGSYGSKMYFATTDSYSLGSKTRMMINHAGNVGIGTTSPSSKLEVYGSGSTILDIQGSQGQLFSVTDDLTGTLFTVSDISGIPIFEVDASGESSFDGNVTVDGTLNATGPAFFNGDIGNSPAENPGVHIGLSAGNDGQIQIIGSSAHIDFANAGSEDYDARIILEGNDELNVAGVGSNFQVNGNRVLTTADEGSGSGLDADTLDGQHASDFQAAGNYQPAGNYVTTDTAQTVSGAKTFSSTSNRYSGHLYYDPWDANGNHYPHFTDGGNDSGVTVNWRLYQGDALITHTWNYGDTNFVNSLRSTVDMRAPIFYDSDNTSYYLNPASTSNLNAINLAGIPQTSPVRGQVYEADTHTYTNSTNYWTYIKVASVGTDSRGFLKYHCKGDQNYPYNVSGIIGVSSHAGSSISISNTLLTPTTAISPQVYIDNNNDIWLRMSGASWTNRFEWNWEYRSGITAYDGSTNSLTIANATLIPVGRSYKFNYVNSGAPAVTNEYTQVHYSGEYYAHNQVKAPIFYDADNTGYYLNPASTSNLNNLTVNGTLTATASGNLPINGKAADSELIDGIDSSRIVYGSGSRKTNNQDPNTAFNSGFYDIYQTNAPTSTWYSYLTMAHTNAGNMHGHQIAGSFYSDGDLFNRHYDGNGSFGNWTRIWNEANDGAGSGLDADLLDGQQGSYYLNYNNFSNTPTLPSANQLVKNYQNVDYVASSGTSGNYRDNYGIGVTVYEGYSGGANRPHSYDSTVQFMPASNHGFEISADWVSSSTTPLKVRSLRDCCQGWSPWRDIAVSEDAVYGTFYFATAVRSPIFYDYNNTSYYLDPASTGTSAKFAGSVGIGTISPGYKLDVKNTANTQTSMDSLTFRALSENYAGTVAVFENTSGLNTNIRISDTVDDMYVVSRNGIMGLGPSGGWSSSNLNITSNGDVGIGNRNPDARLHVKGGNIRVDTGSIDFFTNGTVNRGFIGPLGGSLFYISSTYKIVFKTGASQTERMRLNDVGYLGVGTIDPDHRVDVFGAVRASNFYTNSDYRLKSNLVPLTDAITRVKQLDAYRFNWNDRLDEPKVDGFLAHEVSSVVPEAVSFNKDAVHEDGSPKYQGVDQTKIVPLLTAALQEAIQKIEQLETRIQTLENNN